MKKAIFRTLGLAIVVAGGWYGYRFYKQMPERLDVIPTAKVQRGDVVALSGGTGRVTGPHLHWGMRANNSRVDPLDLLRKFSSQTESIGPNVSVNGEQ